MNSNKRTLTRLIGVLVLIIAGYFGWTHWHSGKGANDEAEPKEKLGVAQVKTLPVKRSTISETIVAYGSVISQAGKVQTISVPSECRVRHVLVSPGESISKDVSVIEIEPSPETQLALEEARLNAEAAAKDLKLTKDRFDIKLATNQELGTAQQAARTAQGKLENLEKRGLSAATKITASDSGLVAKVDVQDGQIVPAGGPLIELIAENDIQVKLGIERSDLGHLQVGQPVRLSLVSSEHSDSLSGQISLITQRVNPETRLVDVFVSLPAGSKLMLEEYIRGEIVVESTEALVVPRAAVLPRDGGQILFTTKDQHAVKHVVKIGLENDDDLEVIGSDLQAGDSVVVSGNYELEEGMGVDTGKTP